MKGKKIKDGDPVAMNDTDLDIAIGALQEELEVVEHEIEQAGRVGSRLSDRRDAINDKIKEARKERKLR